MNENCFYKDFTATTEKMLDREDETLDSIQVFCQYIAENSNFKYNETYLTDQIEEFIEKIKVYKKRKEEIEKLCSQIDEHKLKKKGAFIIVDHLILISHICKGKLLESIKEDELKELSGYSKCESQDEILNTIINAVKNEMMEFSLRGLEKSKILIKYYEKNECLTEICRSIDESKYIAEYKIEKDRGIGDEYIRRK